MDPITSLFGSPFGGAEGAAPQPSQTDRTIAQWFPDWNLKNVGVIDPWDPSSEEFWKRINGQAQEAAANPRAPASPPPAVVRSADPSAPPTPPAPAPSRSSDIGPRPTGQTAEQAATNWSVNDYESSLPQDPNYKVKPLQAEFKAATAPKVSTAGTWTARNPIWQSLSPHQKAAAMAMMEADNIKSKVASPVPGSDGQPDKVVLSLSGFSPEEKAKTVAEYVTRGYGSITHQLDINGSDKVILHKSDKAQWWINTHGDRKGPSNLDQGPAFTGPKWANDLVKQLQDGTLKPGNVVSTTGKVIDVPEQARNAIAAMNNRAAKYRQDIGEHVSTRLYQPTFEPSQEARLQRLINTPEFKALTEWSQEYAAGKLDDPTNGSTHFLAHPRTMLALEARNPAKYRSWRGWTGFDPATGQYKGTLLEDPAHAYLAPDGRYSVGRQFRK